MSVSPLFSIVIPTRNRGHLLASALKSALAQDFDDFEIIVSANDCHDDTRLVVESFKNPRIKYFETASMLTMPENWEFAWTKASGKYITYLPDDDALAPSTLKTLANHALHENPQVVSWEDANYYYPDWHEAGMQNILLLFHFGDQLVEDVLPSFYLNQLAQFDFAWSSPLPKLLNCIAHREFFERVRQRLGKLFFPIAPDYSFAWIASTVCSNIKVIHRPFSIRGISDHSIGSNAALGEAGKKFFQEFGEFNFFNETNLALPLSLNHLAATFLRVSRSLWESDFPNIGLNQKSFIRSLANQLIECKALLPEWAIHQQTLLDYAQGYSQESHHEISELFSTPELSAGGSSLNTETLRELHQRTAHMTAQYDKSLDLASKQHMEDEACGRCVLAMKKEVIADPSWTHLYLFGEELDVYDAFGMSQHVDYYYDLMLTCKNKKTNYLAFKNENLAIS